MANEPHHSYESEAQASRPSLSRRRILMGVGVAGLAGAGATAGSLALFPELSARMLIARDRFTDRLREQWSERSFSKQRSLKDEADYRAFLANLSLRYLTADEVIRPHRNVREGVANELPPRHMWPRLVPTLKVADEIRHRLGTPLNLINSAYRSPEYNLACSGAKHSFHMQNRALDLMFRDGSKAAVKVALQLREEGFFRGGIGYYDTFIHVDTRGFDSTWGLES